MSAAWGVLSTGRIAESFVRDLVRAPEASLVAVASRSSESAQRFADAHGGPRAHGSLEALAGDDDVQIVYVAGIHPVHHDHAIAMMRAGKHVLVEKPLAMNATEVAEMIAVSNETGRFMMEAMWMRFNPLHVELHRRLSSGEFGRPLRLECDFSFAAPNDPSHRLFDPSKGGGALLDVGIYPITQAWWWLGAPVTWSASGTVGPTGVDESVDLEMAWDTGAEARLTCGTTRNGTRTTTLTCEEATITIPAPSHSSPVAHVERRGTTETITCDEPGLHHQTLEVQRCVAAGLIESPRMTHADSRAIAAFMDQVLARLHGG